MAVEKLFVSYAGKFFNYSKTALKKGVSYVTKESKDVLINHTKIGRRLRDGVRHAKEAVKVKMQKIPGSSDDILSTTQVRFEKNAVQAWKNLSADKQFMQTLEQYKQISGKYIKAPNGGFASNDPKVIQYIIESLGVGPTKAAQIISNNPKLMQQIETKFGPDLVAALKGTQSKCFATRTLQEAQDAITRAFPTKNIVVDKALGVASIGETYLVRRPDGTIAVAKMIKQGVTKQQLELEEKILNRLLKEFADSPQELSKVQSQLKTLYKDWAGELNFTSEMANNKLLAKGAQRYKVANITDIADDASCIIMDKANGIQMNKLVNILKDYKANPSEFATKYADEIAANPWLANPEKVAKELPTTLLKTFDEQFMFMKSGGKSIMHGDPHTGNFFITANSKGKLIPEFIDTGNCVIRNGAQIKNDIGFFTNYFVGNSKGVAEYFVKQCGYTGANKELVTKQVAKEIQETIFGKVQNVRKVSDVQANINVILERNGLQMAAENATAMKAQMQFFSVVSEVGKLTGQPLHIATIIKDVPRATWGMVKSGVNPWGSIKDAVKFAYYNQKQALGTAYQFKLSDVDKVVKADGSLAAIV